MSIAVVARKTLIPVSRTSLVTLLRVTLNAYRWPWLSILTSTVSSSTRLHYITYKIYKARYTKSSRSDSKMLTVKVRIHFTAGCQPAGRNVVNIHSIKRATSSTVHTAALLRRNDVINVLAGPFKRRLARLICIVHPTGCTIVKCKHRVRLQGVWITGRL